MNFLCVCSGISAATVALQPLGWEAVGYAEIERFPSAVLAHHYPTTPNFGDLTKHHDWPAIRRFRVLIGGTPCQGFSEAGLGGGLDDPRSRVALSYVELAAKHRPDWMVWENVPGVLSCHGGRDFATILGAITGRAVRVPRGGWKNSGVIEGIAGAYGVAWRVLDAQHFGVPQRRRRVFLVGYLGDWRLAAAVLFERDCLLGNPPPSRESRKDLAGTLTASALDGSSPCGGDGREGLLVASVAPTLPARTKSGGGLGTDFDLDGGLVGKTGPAHFIPDTVGALCSNGKAAGSATTQDAIGGHLIAGTVTAKWAKGSGGPSGDECQNLVTSQDIAPPLTGNPYGDHESRDGLLVAFNLRGREGGAMPEMDPDELACQRAASGGSSRSYVAFDCKASGQNGFGIGEIAPTLRAMGHKTGNGNAGGQVAIAFDSTQITHPENRSNPLPGDPCHTLAKEGHPPAVAFTIHGTDSDGEVASEDPVHTCLRAKTPGGVENSSTTVVISDDDTYVRRLTPIECERLQGFPDNYTLIPGDHRARKPKDRAETVAYLISHGCSPDEAEALADHPDGCRYHALGNSKATPVVRWIGERIDAVERLTLTLA